MKNLSDDYAVIITIDPTTVYISSDPDRSSYADIKVTMQNSGSTTLNVDSIAIKLPAALAPYSALSSIVPVAQQPNLWNFDTSQINTGEFDAEPQSGDNVTFNAGQTWSFTLQMVTLTNTIGQPSANVIVTINFSDTSTISTPLVINIAKATASILKFDSVPVNISPGEAAALSWQCSTEIKYCIISPIDESHRDPVGSHNVNPDETTVYSLFAYGEGITLSAQWAISVDNPQIIEFGAAGGQTRLDYGSNITLIWDCNQFAQKIAMDNDSGVFIPELITKDNTPQKGTIAVGPIKKRTTFTFTAYGQSENYDQRNLVIGINDVVCAFWTDAGNEILWPGDNVTLMWNVKGATAVSLTPPLPNGPSLENLSGSVVVSLTQDSTFILSVSGFRDNSLVDLQLPVSVLVNQPSIRVHTLLPNPITPDSGPNQATLSWDVWAKAAYIDNGIGLQPVTGSILLTAPPDGTEYMLVPGPAPDSSLPRSVNRMSNAYGPYAFNTFITDPKVPIAVDFVIPSGDSLQYLQPGLASGYAVTFTGVRETGDIPAGSTYAGFPFYSTTNPAQSYIRVVTYPFSLSKVSFEWSDLDNPSGTIVLSLLQPPPGELSKVVKALESLNGGI
jgi:hypothetical protein